VSLRAHCDRGYLPVTLGTLASGRACIGRLSSLFLAPHTLQTRWFATSGTGSRFGRSRLTASIRDDAPADRAAFAIADQKPRCYRSQNLADAVMSTPMPTIASPISKSAGLWLKR
jgi:hypothetical protein